MKNKFESFKFATERVLNQIKDRTKTASASLNSALQDQMTHAKIVTEDFKKYLASDKYEADLDEAIAVVEFLQFHLNPASFDHIQNRTVRLMKKKQYLYSAAQKLIGSAGACGAAFGVKLAGIEGAAAGGALGSGASMVYISLSVGGIAFRRFNGKYSEVQLIERYIA